MKNSIKIYIEENNRPLVAYFNTLSKGILDVYSSEDKYQRATYNYVVSLKEPEEKEAKKLFKHFRNIGVIE